MTAAPPSGRTGAVRADEPRRRRRGLLWLLLGLLALLALIALAVGLYLGLRNDDPAKQVAGQPPAPASAAPAAPSAAAGSAPSAASGAGGSTGSAGAAGATSGPGGLVGGAGVPAAAAGSVPDGSRLAAAGTLGTVLFAEDSAQIDSAGRQVVAAAVSSLRTSGARQVQVTGYTDVVGGQPVNGSLSQQRADAVAGLLRSQLGSGVTVSTAARGQADPVVPNDTDAHRQLNRRATITTR